jgi:anti-anti-sigma factor
MENRMPTTDLIPAARQEADALIVAVRGEVDLHNSPELRAELFDLLGRTRARRLILDMGEVPYMDSSALAVLVEALKKLTKAGGKVVLFNLQPRVRGLIEIARLTTVLGIAKDEGEALAK